MADSKNTYTMKGRLTASGSGWVLLEVPNDIGNGCFKAMTEIGIEQPTRDSTGRYHAHISVMRPEELEPIGGAAAVTAIGQTFGFNVGPLRELVNPAGWPEVSRVWFLEAYSPDLMKLRRSLGLGEPKYPFHITVAIRKRGALDKRASLIHFEKQAGRSVVIRESEIHGKGLFAHQDFEPGDVIFPQFMTRMSARGELPVQWEQSEAARYTNHRNRSNAEVEIGATHVSLIATQPISRGEEITVDYARTHLLHPQAYYYTYHGRHYRGEAPSSRTSVS